MENEVHSAVDLRFIRSASVAPYLPHMSLRLCRLLSKVPIFMSGESLGGGLSLMTGLTLYDREVRQEATRSTFGTDARQVRTCGIV